MKARLVGRQARTCRPTSHPRLCTNRIWLLLPLLGFTPALFAGELDYRGNISTEVTGYWQNPVHGARQTSNLSVSGEVELHYQINNQHALTITPFARIDEHDSRRSHVDFRELHYTYYHDQWEFRAGLIKVFWGVVESDNVVDVINQIDNIENDDASAKLGQPAVSFSLFPEFGSVEFYLLPGFREKTFAGVNGRPRIPPTISTDARYESDDENRHIDFAARVSGYWRIWDLGMHVFRGTARDPVLVPDDTGQTLTPFYYQTTQLGFSAQATLDSWLLKTEVAARTASAVRDHVQSVTGFEYTFYDIRQSGTDIGVLAEYLGDSRGSSSTHPFQNDLLTGFRLALNDTQTTEALLGIISDLDGDGQFWFLEASRRLGNSVRLSAEVRLWDSNDSTGINGLLDQEDHLKVEISWHF